MTVAPSAGISNLAMRFSRSMVDAFTGRSAWDIKGYLENNSKSPNPESFNEYPLHVQDWLVEKFSDKEPVVCIDVTKILYMDDKGEDIATLLRRSVYDQVGRIPYIVSKPRHEVEYDPRYIQLVTGAMLYTVNGNIVGMRNLRHDTVEGVLTVPQGHLDAKSDVFSIARLSDLARSNMHRELNEELEVIAEDGDGMVLGRVNLALADIIYDKEFSPRHAFIMFRGVLPELRSIRGKEDYNMLELYNRREQIPGDLLMDVAQISINKILKVDPPTKPYAKCLTSIERAYWIMQSRERA